MRTQDVYRVEIFYRDEAGDAPAAVLPVGVDRNFHAVGDMLRDLLEASSRLPEDIQHLISINVANSIFFDGDLTHLVMSSLQDLPYGLSIEVSQLGDLPEPRKINALFSEFRKINCTVELDNFGGAFSKNPQVFSEYSFDSMKLDARFVQNALADDRRLRLLSLVSDMVKAQGKRIIATGVASKADSDKLAGLGIVLQQGEFIHSPQPVM